MSRRTAELEALMAAVESGEISRQQFLQRALAVGLSGSAVASLLGAESGLGATGARRGPFAQPKRGGAITVAVSPPSYPLSPWKSGDPGSRTTFIPTINYLVRVLPNLHIIPELATSWSSTDAKIWTVKLRQGVKFHNGKPFVADDVVDTFDRLVDPNSGSQALSAFQSFLAKGGTVKVDDHTVRFELTRPVSGFPYSLFTYQAAILPAGFSGDYETHPIGTGPFKLANYTPKQSALLVRNPDYWEPGLPYLDSVKLVYYADPGAEVAAIQSGSADLMADVSQDTIPTLRAGGAIKLLAASSASYAQLAMRTDMKPWNDKRVRQALALSLDRAQIVKHLLSGYGDIGNDHLFAPIYPLTHRVRVPQRTQDYAKAKKLLAAAGHPHGIDVELRTHPIFSLPQYAQVVQAMAKPAGIRIKLTVEPDDLYYQHWNTIPFALEAWIHRPWPSQLLNLGYRCGASWNVPHWCDKRFDNLVSKFDATVGAAGQRALAQQIASMMHDEVPAIVSFFYKTTKAVRSNVHGQVAEPTDYLDLRRTWLA